MQFLFTKYELKEVIIEQINLFYHKIVYYSKPF